MRLTTPRGTLAACVWPPSLCQPCPPSSSRPFLPLPSLALRSAPSRKGSRAVVDGQLGAREGLRARSEAKTSERASRRGQSKRASQATEGAQGRRRARPSAHRLGQRRSVALQGGVGVVDPHGAVLAHLARGRWGALHSRIARGPGPRGWCRRWEWARCCAAGGRARRAPRSARTVPPPSASLVRRIVGLLTCSTSRTRIACPRSTITVLAAHKTRAHEGAAKAHCGRRRHRHTSPALPPPHHVMPSP